MPDSKDALPPLESLRCAECSRFLDQPLTLQCLHSFCKQCLLAFNGATVDDLGDFLVPDAAPMDENNDADDDADDPDDADDEGRPLKRPPPPPAPKRLHCPTCVKLELPLPEAAAEPFSNDRLTRLVRLVKETPVLCQNCSDSESEVRCDSCDAYCCKPCWDLTHNAPIFKTHTPSPLSHSEVSAIPKCPQHKVNDLEFFVNAQEMGACQVCLLKGDFKGALYSEIDEVRATRQQDIESGLLEVCKSKEHMLQIKNDVLDTISRLETNLERSKRRVKENFSAIRKALDFRETETIHALESLKNEKVRVLESQAKAIDVTASRIADGVRSVRLVLDFSNPLEVIYSTYVLQDHLAVISDVPATAPKVCDDCDSAGISACHHPAVDDRLDVVLSDKAPKLIAAYATVADADVVKEVAIGVRSTESLQPKPTPEQEMLLKEVAGGNTDDYGCVVA